MRRLVGRNLARIRRAQGLTQEQLEERSGFSQQYLSGLEQGRRNPTVVTLYELAQALGVSHLDLLQPGNDLLRFVMPARHQEGRLTSIIIGTSIKYNAIV